MQLKTLTSTRAISVGKALILAITAVIMAILLATLLSGCVKEEIPVEATRQLVIPPAYEPETVLPSFGGEIWYECAYEVGKETADNYETCGKYIKEFVEGELENGFIKGYMREYGEYKLRSGEESGIGTHPLLLIRILKYETSQAAKEAFNVFVRADDLIIDGVKIKAVDEKGHA